MIRRLNYTGRKRIDRNNINISLLEENNVTKSFRASINLDSLNLPKDGRVFVEAYYRMMQSQRYDFGYANQIKQPNDTTLGLLGLTENLKFRVFVVDNNGKIQALAENISVKKKINKKSLLPVEIIDLDDLLWKVDMIEDQGAPVLQLNNRIKGIKSIAAKDPRFIHSVYPAVVRYILMYLAFYEKIDFSDPELDWQSNWIRFAENIYTAPPEGTIDNIKELILVWIDEVVNAFSRTRRRDWSSKRLTEWEI